MPFSKRRQFSIRNASNHDLHLMFWQLFRFASPPFLNSLSGGNSLLYQGVWSLN